MNDKLKNVEIGFHLHLRANGKNCGAVRHVAPGDRDELVVYILNEGNFIVPSDAIESVGDSKVVLNGGRLDERSLSAMSRADKRD